jgi:hypothetical protein
MAASPAGAPRTKNKGFMRLLGKARAWTWKSERKPRADSEQAAEELHRNQAKWRFVEQLSFEHRLNVGHAAPGCAGRVPANQPRRDCGCRSARDGNQQKNRPFSAPCAQTISSSRKRSACASASRKVAPRSPDTAPTMGARRASTSRLPGWSVSSVAVSTLAGISVLPLRFQLL